MRSLLHVLAATVLGALALPLAGVSVGDSAGAVPASAAVSTAAPAVSAVSAATAAPARCPRFVARAEIAASDAVFHGRVVGGPVAGAHGQRYRIEVEVPFKGAARDQVTVVRSDGPCRTGKLVTGENYVFFASKSGTRWVADGARPTVRKYTEKLNTRLHRLVGSTGPATSAQVTFGQPLADAPRSFARVAAPGAALAVVGLVGLVLVGWLSRR